MGLDGTGTDTVEHQFWELPVLTFRYLYVGLPGLDAVQYLQGDNWLGVALTALMRIPPGTAAHLRAEALRRLTEAPLSDQQRYLLAECASKLTCRSMRTAERCLSKSNKAMSMSGSEP